MSTNAFRSPLMQHFASTAKSQHRPPLALSRLRASNKAEEASNATSNLPPSSSVMPISASNQYYSGRFALSRSKDSKDECRQIHSFSKHSDQSLHYFSTIQSHNLKNTTNLSNSCIHETISSRRSNILGPINTTDLSHLRDSITKAIEMATYAPNHHRTEPTTYYRIFSNTVSSDKLADICYNVSLCRSLKSKPSQVAISNAEDKKNKWLSTIACYIAVTCSNQPIQDMETNQDYRNSDFTCVDSSNDDEFNYWFHPLSCQYPETERQLEDYASSCSSIQNLLLSLHADKYGSKWATGPVIRCRAFRSLIGCKNDELVVGLIMVGTPKIVPTKPWRRRRDFDGDVLRDL